ncbi:MAG TPA: hypothetical protein VFN52_06765 [Acidiferrobacteraceae bacterium]|nr:hypothetical protein [Acidiferrobacteraceae bacterium]
MIVIVILACLITAGVIWFLTRPGAVPGGTTERLQLIAVRDRLVAQLRELAADRGDHRVDDAIAAAEQQRLEFELAGVLKQIEAADPDPALAVPRHRSAATVAVLAVFIPLVAGSLYVRQSEAWLRTVLAPPPAATASAAAPAIPPFVFQMVARLQGHLQRHPQDLAGWMQLARSYEVLGHPHKAQQAYARAYGLAPRNVQVVSSYAWALYSQDPTRTAGTVAQVYHRLYQLDPERQDALWFLGLEAYNAGHLHGAIGYWQRLLRLMPAASPARKGVQDAIANVQQALKKPKRGVKARG